jgi:hypothetical protein
MHIYSNLHDYSFEYGHQEPLSVSCSYVCNIGIEACFTFTRIPGSLTEITNVFAMESKKTIRITRATYTLIPTM